MRVTKKQKEKFRSLNQQEDCIIRLYCDEKYSVQNCQSLSGWTYDYILSVLKDYDVKRCGASSCEQPIKTWSDFHACKTNKDDLMTECKDCRRIHNQSQVKKDYDKKRYKDNKDYYSSQRKKWFSNNPHKVKEYNDKRKEYHKIYSREYRKKKKATLSEYNRQYLLVWHQQNPEYMKDYNRKYYKKNKDSYIAANAKRRAQRIQATPIYANFRAIKLMYKESARLTIETGIQHEVDHIIPLQGEDVCGLHVEYIIFK